MKYVENFNDWALKMYEEYRAIRNTNPPRWCISVYEENYSITLVLVDLKKKKTGFAKVSEEEYDRTIGIGVAYARLRGYEVPKERKTQELRTLKNQQYFMFNDEEYMFVGLSSPFIAVCVNKDNKIEMLSAFVKVYLM